MKEGTPLKDHLDELNSVLLELSGIDSKLEDGDLAMILLASLPPSYKNFVYSLSVVKDCIMLEKVKSNLYSRELRHKAFGNGDDAFASGLSLTNSAKRTEKEERQRIQEGQS